MKKTLQESTLFHKYAARKNVYKLRMCCHEKILSDVLFQMIHSKEAIEYFKDQEAYFHMPNDQYKVLAMYILDCYLENQDFQEADLYSYIANLSSQDDEVLKTLTNILNTHEDQPIYTFTYFKNLIYEIRGKQVMLASDVAKLYQVETKALNQVVKRNLNRFPEDFCFQLTLEEAQEVSSRSQIVTLNRSGNNRGNNIKYLPYVFTEHGVMMLRKHKK